MGNYTEGTSVPDGGRLDIDLRIRAVEAAIQLYANKTIASLGDYNTKFKELYTEIYNFYGTSKELH